MRITRTWKKAAQGLILPEYNLVPHMAGSNRAPAVAAVTWNPSDMGPNLALTGGNLTVNCTSSGGAVGSVRATLSRASGKYGYEIKVVTRQSGGSSIYPEYGIATSSALLNTEICTGLYGWAVLGQNGNKRHAGSSVAYGSGTTAGNYIYVLVDFGSGTLSFMQNSTNWGTAYSTGISGAMFPAVSLTGATTQDKITANFGATAFANNLPSGYLSWDGTRSF